MTEPVVVEANRQTPPRFGRDDGPKKGRQFNTRRSQETGEQPTAIRDQGVPHSGGKLIDKGGVLWGDAVGGEETLNGIYQRNVVRIVKRVPSTGIAGKAFSHQPPAFTVARKRTAEWRGAKPAGTPRIAVRWLNAHGFAPR